MSEMTYQDVLNILRLIDSGQFEKLEVDYQGTRIKVSRRNAAAAQPVAMPRATAPAASTQAAPESPKAATPMAKAPAAPSQAKKAEILAGIKNGAEVKAPMTGTFYAAPSPGAAPFVETGQAVKQGDQVGIVEVMKLFTAVTAPVAGTVRAILVENQEVVESDQTLIVIEPK